VSVSPISSTDHLAILPRYIRIPDDLSQRKGGDHRDRVSLEVVAELAPREDHRVEQLLDLQITRLSLEQNLADVVYLPLDWLGMPLLRALYYDDGADHVVLAAT
jgi:hypothetical protein